MEAVIAIVGRPNVGKSSLFNLLTKSKDALVLDEPGVTRDRIYGEAKVDDKKFIVIDTGGIFETDNEIDSQIYNQTWQAVTESDRIVFLVDGRNGITAADEEIASKLRQTGKPVALAVNKTDGVNAAVAAAEFASLGLGIAVAISVTHNKGIKPLFTELLKDLEPIIAAEEAKKAPKGIKIAIVGRPGVGKSTLVNRMVKEQRVVVDAKAGTTRDSIYVPLERFGKNYVLIDTAGVRKKSKVKDTIEKFSVVKTLKAITDANVVIVVIDATIGISEKDLNLVEYAITAGKGLLIAVNKWDGMTDYARKTFKDNMWRLRFVDFAKVKFISALHGTGVGDLFEDVEQIYSAAMKEFTTNELSRLLEQAVANNAPPRYQGRVIKLRYMHCGGHNPPLFVIHGNQTKSLPANYRRYLTNFFRDKLNLHGNPIKLVLKTSSNPYAKDKNARDKSDKK